MFNFFNKKNNGKKKKSAIILNYVLFFFLIYISFNAFNNIGVKPTGTITYSQYIENINTKNIIKVVIPDYSNSITVYTKEPIETVEYQNAFNTRKRYLDSDNLTILEGIKKEYGFFPSEEILKELKKVYYEKKYTLLATKNADFLFKPTELKDNNIVVEVISRTTLQTIFHILFASILPTIIMFGFIFYLITKMSENSGLMAKAKSEKSLIETNVKLEDVAGIEEELKLEIIEIIDFIKNPQKFEKLKAKRPKGILMSGLPGVGKTMLAKAIANEAGVDFFYKNGSDLENPYVGMSAMTVKNLFEEAKKSKNAIIFIDEIDSIGSRRNEKRIDTGLINALLTEMDGFEETNNITVIAATNNPEKLDSALLREGRFDRKIHIPLPNVKGREEILKVHLKEKNISEDINLNVLAKLTTGYSGAELAGIVNEAAIFAARENSEKINQEHLMKARDKKIMGVPFKNFEQTQKQKEITAYHEAGHAVLSYFLDKSSSLYKVSILPRTGSLGVTVMVPLEENRNYNKTELNNMIKILFGGRIAEEIFFNEISTGASNDIERATSIAERMVKEWGMSALGTQKIDTLYERAISEDLLRKADEEKLKILEENYKQAKLLIESKYKKQLIRLAKVLIEEEEIGEDKIIEIIEGTNIKALEDKRSDEEKKDKNKWLRFF